MKGKIAKYVTVGTNDLERAKGFYDALIYEEPVEICSGACEGD